ncbi:FMN-binding negative transcriptional regulator [Pseudooceanicola sediminis]|uniref:FMN-binding negative transcriptional regulator n=1 Tax=Pseudooceanicola sediminis TaxID=2211117 RepID=A0A399J460_9RHOB|nr:FMN-binding negative transcriptional regulator [Pseudooceanicola sediminis]KAA2315607.1 FMN-binding negative transcriptional regulator [Puniceibacterium sp. HSS470]RII40193.1 FMN-binding negative transcriptional regulator [Pseudooceanicola sediminis]|tara:strand:+ start:134509 stop:135150 length:642 start_codon:yes stop_codon:yes gene_type:complete
MHPNPIYRTMSRQENLRFAAEIGFGVFCLSDGDAPPLVAQAPFVIDEEHLILHLVRSNPVVRALRHGGRQARLVVMGPHGYVSPDWYGIEDQVPTWNYVSVEVTGLLSLLEEAQMRPVLDRLSENFETRLAPKPVWHSEKMNEPALERMMRAILPLKMHIETVEGTWKLSQNKSDAVRLAASAGMQQASIEHPGYGSDSAALAAFMRGVRGTG